MNPFETKAIFVWSWEAIEGGLSTQITARLVEGNFETAFLHLIDAWSLAKIPPGLVSTLRQAGLNVIGSCAVYGNNPAQEGDLAAAAVRDLGLDGMVFDAESDFDIKPNSNTNAVKLLQAYQHGTTKPSAWCSWAYPHYHVPDIIRAAMELADYGMPMCYWNPGQTAAAAAKYLDDSLMEWRRWTQKPIIPVGRAYNGDGGTASADGVKGFAAEVTRLKLPGLSWWSLYHALKLPEVWEALKATPKMGVTAPPPAAESWEKSITEWARKQPQPYTGPDPA